MFQWILDHAGDLLTAATSVVTAASAIAAITPSTTDDDIVAWLKKIVNFFALNVGNAKPGQ